MELPPIDPVACRIGAVELRWYGLMYLVAFVLGWLLLRLRAGRHPDWGADDVDELVTWVMLGVILGARLGYALFYDPASYLREPAEILRVWHGGMSFHGGLLGALAAFWLFARARRRRFLDVADLVAPAVPQGLLWGRLGNFVNGELWGRPAPDLPWAVVFPGAGPEPRHPSQLYEAALEGILLWLWSSAPRARGRVAGFFALGYGVLRSAAEFARMPDAHLGYLAFGWLTMGQLLCVPLILAGAWLLLRPVPAEDARRASAGRPPGVR